MHSSPPLESPAPAGAPRHEAEASLLQGEHEHGRLAFGKMMPSSERALYEEMSISKEVVPPSEGGQEGNGRNSPWWAFRWKHSIR